MNLYQNADNEDIRDSVVQRHSEFLPSMTGLKVEIKFTRKLFEFDRHGLAQFEVKQMGNLVPASLPAELWMFITPNSVVLRGRDINSKEVEFPFTSISNFTGTAKTILIERGRLDQLKARHLFECNIGNDAIQIMTRFCVSLRDDRSCLLPSNIENDLNERAIKKLRPSFIIHPDYRML
eukprot:UC4_evm2s732